MLHNYENTVGTSYLESGKYRDRVRYRSKHHISDTDRILFRIGLYTLIVIDYTARSGDMQLNMAKYIKEWVNNKISAPTWALGAGAYIILAMVAVTVFRG